MSPTKAELIDAVTDTNYASLLSYMLWGLGFHQDSPTPIYEYNDPTIGVVNSSISTERTHHMDVMFFVVHELKDAGDIIMCHIPSIINPADDITKPLVWILHFSHARYMIQYYNISNKSSINSY